MLPAHSFLLWESRRFNRFFSDKNLGTRQFLNRLKWETKIRVKRLTSHSFNVGLGSRSLDPLVVIWNCIRRRTLTEGREQVTSPHPAVNGAQQIWREGHSISPGDLPSNRDISLPVPPSMTQLNPKLSADLVMITETRWFTTRCCVPGTLSTHRLIEFNSHNYPELGVLIPFSLTRKQVWRVTPHNTVCPAHRGGPGEREGKERTQGNMAPNRLGTQLCLHTQPKGPLWELSATFFPYNSSQPKEREGGPPLHLKPHPLPLSWTPVHNTCVTDRVIQ